MPFLPLFFILLLFSLAAYGEERKLVAILNTEDDSETQMEITDLTYLTGRLREIAVKVLSKDNYSVMTAQSIIDKLGSKEDALKSYKAAKALAEKGRIVGSDYVGQARLGRFNDNLTINMELYNSTSGNLIGSFTGKAKDISGVLAILDEKAPTLFKQISNASGGAQRVVFVTGTESISQKKSDIIVPGLQTLLNDNDVRMTENQKEAGYILKIDATVCNIRQNNNFHYANACVKVVLTNAKTNAIEAVASITGPKEGALSAENAGEKAFRSAVPDIWAKVKDKILGNL
jgi:hypothetical protein